MHVEVGDDMLYFGAVPNYCIQTHNTKRERERERWGVNETEECRSVVKAEAALVFIMAREKTRVRGFELSPIINK